MSKFKFETYVMTRDGRDFVYMQHKTIEAAERTLIQLQGDTKVGRLARLQCQDKGTEALFFGIRKGSS